MTNRQYFWRTVGENFLAVLFLFAPVFLCGIVRDCSPRMEPEERQELEEARDHLYGS